MPRRSQRNKTRSEPGEGEDGPGPSKKLTRASTRAIENSKPNPLFQTDTLDVIFSYFEHNDPKTFLTLRLVCTFWKDAASRWIRKILRWRVGRTAELSPFSHIQEKLFAELMSTYAEAGEEMPEIFTNFHMLHNNTGTARFSEKFVDTVSPKIVDLRLLGSRRSYVDLYLPPCAPELCTLEIYKLSQVQLPNGKEIDDFEFGNVLFPKLENVILRGVPHPSTTAICIKLMKNSPKLENLTLGLQTAAICQVIDAAARGDLNLTGLTALRTHVHYTQFNLIYGDGDAQSAHLPHPQMVQLGNLCPNLTHIAIAISDTNDALNTAIEVLNVSYAKQLVDLEVVVRDLDPRSFIRHHREERGERYNMLYDLAERVQRNAQFPARVHFDLDGERHELYEIGDEYVEVPELPAFVVLVPVEGLLGDEKPEPPGRRQRQIQLNMFPLVTRLHLANWPLRNNFSLFTKFPCLKSVDLQPQLSEEAYVTPMRLIHSKVSKVRFMHDRVTGDTIEALASVFPNMKDLEISDPLHSAYARMWTELPVLKKLKLVACKRAVRRRRFEDPFFDEGVTGIFRQVLRGLATNVRVDPATLRRDPYIGELKYLEDLTIELQDNQITQRVVDFGFAHLPALRWLKITMQQEQATIAVKPMVDNCPELRKLDVRDDGNRYLQARLCKISDVDYAMLKRPDLEIVPSEDQLGLLQHFPPFPM